MTNTIMVVDDEPRIVSVIESYLAQYGYRVVKSYNGEEALVLAEKEKPDLIILDIMMPKMDGYEFLRQHRKQANTPIIFLTARVEDEDKVLGLRWAPMTMLSSPSAPELMARVKAVLRRGAMVEPDAGILSVDDLVLNRDNRTLHMGSENIDLTPSEFDLLTALMSSPGKVFSRLDLLDIIQGVRFEGYERTIDLHIKNLRAKLKDNPRKPKYIQTVYGAGYRMIGE